jgi:hypothetical protein
MRNSIKIFSMMISLSMALQCAAGTWEVVDEKTISFKGLIEDTEYEKFESFAAARSFKSLIVESQGGDVEESLKIAQYLVKIGLEKIIIEKYCFSSCANYLFLSANEKDISKGVVGFHGGVFVLLEKRRQFLKPIALSRMEKTAVEEKKFFLDRGIDTSIFTLSGELDKGQKDGNVYQLWIPLKTSLEKFGIKGLIGNYSESLLKNYQKESILIR